MRPAAVAMMVLLAAPATARERPQAAFDPVAYFAGATRSSGVVRKPGGEISSRFTGETRGRRAADGSAIFNQAIRFDDGTVRRRSWCVVRTGPETVEATGTDVVDEARGGLRGRTLRLLSTIRLDDGNPFSEVEFDQTMELRRDGRTVTNRSTVTKLGFTVRTIEEVFVRTRVGSGLAGRRSP